MLRATTKFKALLGGGNIVVAPGAFDALSARLIEQAGFLAVYASGGAIARSSRMAKASRRS
jgi:2-methylisocitrate lyase-like PEP mutase family enzyme